MLNVKTKGLKLITLICGFAACVAVLLGIVFASPTSTVYAAGETQIDTLGVAFRKVEVGDTLDAAFEFENATTKTLNVPAGANYTATLEFVSKNGQATTLWEKGKASYPWSRVENQLIEQKVAYCIRVSFVPKENYKLSKDVDLLKRNMQVLGAELGKGKDIELWDAAGQNSITTAVQMDFIISKGMTYIGYTQTVYPEIGVKVTGKIGTLYTDTGIWLRGAPGPYTYEAKIAPVGTDVKGYDGFNDESTCNYQVLAVNAMDGGTMYITATAADGQTCDIPVMIAAVSGGHEHTWSDFGKIDLEHHGYRKCTASGCPGVAPAFDKGAQYTGHTFYDGCNAKCKECGDLENPAAKHNFAAAPDESDGTCHVFKCACGEVKKDDSGNIIKEKHGGGTQTCLSDAKCDVCGKEYLAATGHKYDFRSFGNNDGTYTHLGFCKYCGKEDTTLRHSPTGGTATCQARAECTYKTSGGDVCGCVYGEFKAHNFVDGICTECSSDEYIREVVIDVPEFYKGMAYKPLFYPAVIKGNVIDMGIYYYKASLGRDTNHYLCGSHNYETTYITENSVMCYAFKPQTNCKFPDSIDDVKVSVTHGEVLRKRIRENDGCLAVDVLLRIDEVVQAIDVGVSQPIAGNLAESLKITEKNGLEFTIKSIGPLDDNKIIFNTPLEIDMTIKAPAGKVFQGISEVSLQNWLCDFNLSGGNVLVYALNTDKTELTLTVQTPRAIECPHETVVLAEAGKLETCTEDGVKDKYACEGCGKEFFDAACTMPWNAKDAVIPKGHLCDYHEETPCSAGNDGNAAYYECRRKDCGKLFADYACTREITLAETVIHDYKTEWSADKNEHYHECKNCEVTGGKAAHRPDRAEATDEDPVKCLDCGYIVTPALGHTTHRTTLVPGEEATCLKTGRKAYYKCDGCEVRFEDAEGTKPVADESALVIPKAHRFGAWTDEIPATEESNGVKGHKDCEFCKKHFDENGTEITDLTLVYENKQGGGEIVPAPEKKGLPGGAIAGIAVGGVAVAGIGGFAIFWFAVKKKTFADLIAAIKGAFKK